MNHTLDPADRFDPVRLHFLEALARRTQDHQGAVKHLLEDKLTRALATYQERFTQHANSASDLQRLESPPQPTALSELTRTLTQHLPKNAPANTDGKADESGDGSDASMGSRPELKSIRYFRNTWSKLSVDKQLSQAIAQGPENAGPLNSHQLVLRSLSVMRDISPDYLNRFMSYVDALLWLDQAESVPVAKSAPDDEGRKKRKTSRAR
jgi:hypothetical protein